MIDYVLEIAFDDPSLEDVVLSRLFLAPGRGSTTSEEGSLAIISAWFDTPEDRAAAMELLGDLPVELRAVERERRDWLELYEQSLEPIFAGRRFVVAPDASLIPSDTARLPIVIPQEQAFGTGSHESTALCLELLESLDLRGRRGLDVGSGSGILAIAMLRLGAAKAVAFDNDADTFAALRLNRVRNAIAPERMPVYIGGIDALRNGMFDVVTMNILPEVIVELFGRVRERMAAGATLLVSGIILPRREEVVAAARAHGLATADERTRGEWWAARFVLLSG
ncbi:MAG TPA: 50S ribosomal protein L11 methyltransferase [Thermoanaerobaculia bacterium]|nr:50S ribosomal protein L11 methyltransferase [Thermoanaerobaculia bacterium]